jgi:putative drug exporter of the RND superfamily
VPPPAPLSPSHPLLGRLADAMFVHRRRVFAGWAAALVLAILAAATLGGQHVADYTTPGSDSQAASEQLEHAFGGRSGEAVDIVWRTAARAPDPAATKRVDKLLADAGHLKGVLPGTTTRDAEVSPDGRTAVVRLALDRPSSAVPSETGKRLAELVAAADGDDLQVAANGSVTGLKAAPGMNAETVGIVIAAIVLLLTLGGVVAAGLPLLTALIGVGIAVAAGSVLAAVLDTPDWAVQVSTMIGIGVGIDYALLILTRYRTARQAGRTPRAANVDAMTTAGHSVLVAGATVVIALMGLFLMRLPYLYGVALASSIAVLTVMATMVTLLPAAIGAAGRRLDRVRLFGDGGKPADPHRILGARWARLVLRRPAASAVVAVVLLGVLATPLAGIRFGFPDAGNDTASSTTRKAYDMVAEGFGPGANGPLVAVAETTGTPRNAAAVARMRKRIAGDPAVAAVSPAQRSPDGRATTFLITPKGSPESTSTKDLVDRLRDGVLDDGELPVHLGGLTAASIDQGSVTARRLPLFIGAVVALAFVLLLGAFRAPLIALKAAAMTVLSIVASYGVVALVAEGGWAGRLVGIDTDLPVPPFIPVMMFAVLFGLSMDYEVFLVSRIAEERERLGDARAGVTAGLALTARVIVAAAAIMVAVFGAFALSPDVMLKLIGVGLAAAILIDVALVRMILVPAVLRLLGERTWWQPNRLRKPQHPSTHPARSGA